ncbi:MAG: hypothetical protein V5A42_03065, partial [Halofilum sp. (in: g-proteobacteria)]
MRKLRRQTGGRDVRMLELLTRELFGGGLPGEAMRQAESAQVAMMTWLYDFYVERPPGEANIRVLESTTEREGWELPYAVVAVATDDRPFLVDSVSIAIAECDTAAQAVFHPEFEIRRDESGRLRPLTEDGDDAQRESLMLFWIERPVPEATVREITERIETALSDVESAVGDWRQMRQRAEDLVAALESEVLPEKERTEAQQFLRWMADNHFTFLGYREYVAEPLDGDRVLKLQPDTGLGILRAERKRGRMRSIPDLEA